MLKWRLQHLGRCTPIGRAYRFSPGALHALAASGPHHVLLAPAPAGAARFRTAGRKGGQL